MPRALQCLITTQELDIRQPHQLDLCQQKRLLHVYKLLFHKVETISLTLFPMLFNYCVMHAKPASAHWFSLIYIFIIEIAIIIVSPRSPVVRWVNSGIGVLSGVQSGSRDWPVCLMGDEYLVHILERLSSIPLNPVYSGLIQFLHGFLWVSAGTNLDQPGLFQPLRCTISLWPPDPDEGSPTGCLWWSLMGGEVTYMHHISRGRCEPWWWPQPYVLGDLVGIIISRVFQF